MTIEYTLGVGFAHLMGEPRIVFAWPASGELASRVDCLLRVAIVWLTVSLMAAVAVVAGAGAAAGAGVTAGVFGLEKDIRLYALNQ